MTHFKIEQSDSYSVITLPWWRDDGIIKCQECGHPMNDSIQNLAPWCAGGEQVWRVGDGQVLITNIDLMICSRNMPWWPTSAHRFQHCSSDELPITHKTTNIMQRGENNKIIILSRNLLCKVTSDKSSIFCCLLVLCLGLVHNSFARN